jgi:hypothetical protein
MMIAKRKLIERERTNTCVIHINFGVKCSMKNRVEAFIPLLLLLFITLRAVIHDTKYNNCTRAVLCTYLM